VTREQKLALIVGFTLVLVVGILISDHLSPASTDRPLEALAFRSPLGELPPAVVIDERPAKTQPEPVAEPKPEVVPTRDQDRKPAAESPRKTEPFKPTELTQGVTRITPESREPIVRRTDSDTRNATGGRAQVKPPAAGPGFASYVVKPGESLSSIASRLLGSASKWKVLAELNRDRVGKDGSVRSGVTLRLPDSAKTRTAASTTPRKQTQPRVTAGPRSYTVRGGDTLSQIAMRELGTMRRADEILSLNKDKIRDADEIYSGLVLALPAN
jgi:nucleoid-associated protein YgaU